MDGTDNISTLITALSQVFGAALREGLQVRVVSKAVSEEEAQAIILQVSRRYQELMQEVGAATAEYYNSVAAASNPPTPPAPKPLLGPDGEPL